MFTPKYYTKAAELGELAKASAPDESALHRSEQDGEPDATLAATEEHVLRCLGAAVLMEWNTIPKKLQRELFDTAGSMGDLLNVATLRGQIARFLHKHKDDER